MIPVSRNDEKIVFGHNGGFGELIAALLLLVLDKTLHNLNYARALGHHKRQALTYVLVGHKQAEFSADLVVIAQFCVFEFLDILVKLGIFGKQVP